MNHKDDGAAAAHVDNDAENYERGYTGHGRGIVVTNDGSGNFSERPMTAGELAAREPAWAIGADPYEFLTAAAAFAYFRCWEVIAPAIDAALDFRDAALREAREEIDDLWADAANDLGYRQSVERSFAELCRAVGVERGTENWEPWIAVVRARFAGLTASEADLTDLQRTFDLRWAADMRAIKRWQGAAPGRELIWPDHADLVVWLLEREARLADAALGCSEGMACRRPVWFGCCATRKRICEALGIEFHVEPIAP